MSSIHIAASAVWSGGENEFARAKLATLFFDRITVAEADPLLLPVISVHNQNEPALTPATLEFLRNQWTSVPSLGLRLMQTAFDGEPVPEQLRIATARALQERNYKPSQSYDDYKWSLMLQGEILEWWRNHKRSGLIAADDADAILRYCGVADDEPPRADRTLVEVPDMREVRWNDLPALRKSRFLGSFRRKYESLLLTGSVDALAAEYGEALERLADHVRPNSGVAFANAVLSYIPFGAFNPFHARSNIDEVTHEVHLERNFGWAFFLRELRAKKGLA